MSPYQDPISVHFLCFTFGFLPWEIVSRSGNIGLSSMYILSAGPFFSKELYLAISSLVIDDHLLFTL